jgi:hypothetical protein
VALAILAQVAVAFAVAATVDRFGVVSALYAAFLTGTAACLTLFGGIVLGRCVEGFGLGGSTCGWQFTSSFVDLIVRRVVIQGAIIAIPAALLGWFTGTAARRLAAIRSWRTAGHE